MPKTIISWRYDREELRKISGLITESENQLKTGRARRMLEFTFTSTQMEVVNNFIKRFKSWYNRGVPDGWNLYSESEKTILDKLIQICLQL